MLLSTLVIITYLSNVYSAKVTNAESAAEMIGDSLAAKIGTMADDSRKAINLIKGLQGVSSKAAAVKATPTTSANCDASVCVLSSTFGADPVATAVTPVKLSITTTAFFIPKFRPFNGPSITTQIVITACGYTGAGTAVQDIVDANNYKCPTKYFSSDGHLIQLDDVNQVTQFNFTIPSSNSTCQGITLPFTMLATGNQLTNSFIENTWVIDCHTGQIGLSDPDLNFCLGTDPIPSFVATRNADSCANAGYGIFAENLMIPITYNQMQGSNGAPVLLT